MGSYDYGVVLCDLERSEPMVELLCRYYSYEDAFKYYKMMFNEHINDHEYLNQLWLAFINEDNQITQFDQLQWKKKTKIVEL